MKKTILSIALAVLCPLLTALGQATNNKITGVDLYGTVIGAKDKMPLNGATVKVTSENAITSTNPKGEFKLHSPKAEGILVISYIGYKPVNIVFDINTQFPLKIILAENSNFLNEISVVSNGYQTLSKERSTGSFDQIDNTLINRSVSTNIIDRLNGIASGVIFNNSSTNNISLPGDNNKTGITIRGISTLNTSAVGGDPLIVLDNFRYNGDLRTINPNDVESITILKDAAAASIWGARAGNGVIVITTKKGKLNQPMRVEFNSNVTITNKPNVFYDKNFLDSKDFIGVETYLFKQGYFDYNLTDTYDQPVISPVVEILAAERAGTLSTADANAQLNTLANHDVRHDLDKYVYQKAINQQYSLGIRGGSPQLAYAASVGYDDNRNNMVRDGQQRITVNSTNTYTPTKNLEFTAAINYSQTNIQQNSQSYGGLTDGGGYGLLPYASFADANGNPLSIVHGYRTSYIDSLQRLGFLDQHYRPLNEIAYANNTAKISDLQLTAAATYHFTPSFNAQVIYKNDHQITTSNDLQDQQTYYTSNLINQFAQYNPTTKTFTYPFPLGSILSLQNYTLNDDNFRTQFNYNLIDTFVKNEKFVEGELITPDWYFIQQLTSVHLEVLTKKIEKSIRLYDEYILALAAYFDSNGNYLLCSFIAQKGYEYIIKYQFALSELESTLNTLGSLEVLKDEYKWEMPDIAGLRLLLKNYDWRGLKYIAKYAEQLAVLQWDSRFPDLYSYTYSIINTYINSTFLSNEYAKFEEIFPPFLSATISGYNTLTKNFQHYTLPYRITYQTLLDLMEISGYAYLYAYLYSDTRYWEIVKTTWDNLYPITEDNIKLAVANYSIYKTRIFGTGINFGEKHQRQLVFQEVLSKQNGQNPLLLKDAPLYIKPYFSLRQMGGYYEVSELFIELYFFTFLEAMNAVPKMKRNLFDHWCHIYSRPTTYSDD